MPLCDVRAFSSVVTQDVFLFSDTITENVRLGLKSSMDERTVRDNIKYGKPDATDEATSSIDTRTEILVQEGIAELLKKRTSFVVAHRLSTIRNADGIFVIDDGGILEWGNHETLMAKRGAYYNLYSSQFVSAS